MAQANTSAPPNKDCVMPAYKHDSCAKGHYVRAMLQRDNTYKPEICGFCNPTVPIESRLALLEARVEMLLNWRHDVMAQGVGNPVDPKANE
jgi:hypothetical protein